MNQPPGPYEERVDSLLRQAAGAHAVLLAQLPPEISRSLPVDAQGVTQAIDHLANAAGFSEVQRRELFRGHAVNPAVLHARVFGASGLTDSTVIGAFIDGARVRARALVTLADKIGGEVLGRDVRRILADHPPPVDAATDWAVDALREAYAGQEETVLLIARHLDG
jgi:hypothetical protein